MLHPELCWVGLPMHIQKTNIYNLETGEYSSTPPLSKQAFGGSNLVPHFWRGNIWWENIKKTFGGTIPKKNLAGVISHFKCWREHFGRSLFGRKFEIRFFIPKTLQNAPFLNKGSET